MALKSPPIYENVSSSFKKVLFIIMDKDDFRINNFM